jgi:hypothetical protein
VKQSGNRHDRAAQRPGDPPAQYADQNCSFKTQIGALEVFYAKAKVDSKRKGNAGKENKEDVALARSSSGKQQLLELMRAAQRAGNSGGYTQLEKKLYEQVLKVHRAILSQNRCS